MSHDEWAGWRLARPASSWGAVSAVSLLPWIAVLLLAAVVSDAAPAAAAASQLRLMTYNLNFGNPRPETSLLAIEQEDADIVLLQEITNSWKHALDRRFAKQYPHRIYRLYGYGAGGIAVLSKHPIAREELWAPPAGTGAWFPAQRLVIDGPLGQLQILNVHLRPALMDGSWIKGFIHTPPLRRKEIEAHWKKLDTKLPTIIAGDFNEDPTGRAIDYLQQHGLVRIPTTGPTTWHYDTGGGNDLLKLDIDHVMIDGRLSARDGRVLDAGTSDHRPVVVTLEAKQAP
jgi:endonuclease/exonuclease/phosphatase (EEP) superfamily protein YafD